MVNPRPMHAVTTTSLVERVELRGHAREDAGGHLRSIGVAMELLVRRFADARARRVRFADERSNRSPDSDAERIERDLLERAFDVGELRLQAGQRLAEEAQRLEEPHHVRADPARRPEVHDLHRDAPADPIEPADPLFRRPTVSTAGRTARGGGRTRSCGLRLRHSVDTSRLGPSGSRNRATSVSRRAGDSSSWKTPVATCARWLSAVRSISSVSRCATKTSVFSRASRQRGACDSSHSRRGSAGVHRLGLLRAASRLVRPSSARRAPLLTRAPGGRDRSSAAGATACGAAVASHDRFDGVA